MPQEEADSAARVRGTESEGEVPPIIIHEVLRFSIQPFGPATRAFTKRLFEHDFGVSVHMGVNWRNQCGQYRHSEKDMKL